MSETKKLKTLYEIKTGRPRPHGIVFTEKSRTLQSYAAEVDIKNLLSGRCLTSIKGVRPKPIFSGDKPINYDLQTILQQHADTLSNFESLSPELKERFGSVEVLNAFVQDPKNYDESVKLGLLVPRTEQGPVKVEVINQPAEQVTQES